MKKNIFRRSRGASVIACAMVLAVGLPVLGAHAEETSQPSTTTSGASSSSTTQNGLNVVVGQTVATTVDQNGNSTPFSLFILNGQVSGNGQGDLVIPTSPDGTNSRQVSSQSGQVSNFLSLAGRYSGSLPLQATTSVKLNGQPIDADKAVNMTGDVEITYTVVNKTAREQKITYTDMYGVKQTAEEEIPVPFGDSFGVTFGDGWDITDPGSLTKATTATGTTLTTSLVLFPILQGVVGGTTQSVTIKARAQNASLPSTKHTIVPVKLNTYYDGLALQLAPGVDNKLLTPLNNTLDGSLGQIVLAANMVSGFTAGFYKLDQDYIDPMVQDITKIQANPKQINSVLGKLSNGLTDLGQLLDSNAVSKDDIADLFEALSQFVGKDVKGVTQWLGSLIKEIGPQAGQASDALSDLAKILDQMDPAELASNNQIVKNMCSTVGATTDYFGGQYVNLVVKQLGGVGATALADAISAGSPIFGSKQPWVAGLQSLQTALNNQASGSLMVSNSLAWGTLDQLNVPDLPASIKAMLLGSACGPVTDLAGPVAAGADAAVPVLNQASGALGELSDLAKSPEAQQVYDKVIGGLSDLSLLLSNTKCSSSAILDPIVSAITKYGASGLESHAVQIVTQIFSKCGLAQIMTFFGDFDQAIGKLLTQVAKVVDDAQKDVPAITKGIKSIQSLAGFAGTIFNTIPVAGDKIGAAVSKAAEQLGGKGAGAIGGISDFAGKLQASLAAMNERGLAGDGAPYGNAYLSNQSVGSVNNFTAYQITVQGAEPYVQNWVTALVIAGIALLLSLGIGTYLFRRKIKV